jgi:peroxiredoxin
LKKNKKQRRLVTRTIILVVLFSLVGYALYQNLNKESGNIEVGDPAINFKLDNIEGNEVELDSLKGKVVLVNFWGTWCKPCEKEMPAIQSAYDKYNSDGFEVLAVNIQESNFAVKKYINKRNLEFPVLLDKSGAIKDKYDVYNIPSSFFIDREGRVAKVFEGEMDEGKLDSWVEELVK